MKRATIHDVARVAGISISTVSHVINNTAKISDPIRNRVHEAIAELNYVPNGRKRSKDFRTVAVVIPDITNEFYARCARGIMKCAEEHAFTPLFCDMTHDYKRLYHSMKALIEKDVDGIIFLGGSMDENIILGASEKLPVVLGDRKFINQSLPSVMTDNITAVRNLIFRLKQSGYTKIGYLGERAEMSNVSDRYMGFKHGLEENGLKFYEEFVLEEKILMLDKVNNTYKLVKEKFSGVKHLPEVFVTTSDLIAVGAMGAFRELNVSIPKDIGVVGFDDISIASLTDPPLTTIAQDMERIGTTCFLSLLNTINRTDTGILHHSVDATLKIRKTVSGLK